MTAGTPRTRLDQFLAGELPAWSRSQVQGWIRAGHVQVNGTPAKSGHPVRPGDVVTVDAGPPDADEAAPLPEDIPLLILYADPHLAVVDKPAGMVCHAGAGVRTGTLVNALLHHLGNIDTGDASRPGIVHRLDRGTSGVLVIARNTAVHRELARQFKDREVKKEYLALVHGVPQPPSGTVDRPLGRDPVDRKKISVRARRVRSAVTHYQLAEAFPGVALLNIRIETGRTHQIRVHMASIGHPVVGDQVYGANRSRSLPAAAFATLRPLARIFLHARRLQFRHPVTGEDLCFESPLPPELENALQTLRRAAG